MSDRWVSSASSDLQIHVVVEGQGPCVLLLPGTGHDSDDWQRAGYVAGLAGQFTTVSVDLPGQGRSSAPIDPANYYLSPMLGVLDAVADDLAVDTYAVLGYSFGGSLALQAAAHNPRVYAAVAIAATLGHPLDAQLVERSAEQAMAVHQAKLDGTLDTLGLSDTQLRIAQRLNIPAHLASLRGEVTWPPVLADMPICPTMLYLGGADRLVLAPTGLAPCSQPRVHIQPGLDHDAVFETATPAIAAVTSFLAEHRRC